MNDFEQRLRQVPRQPLPPAWRAEILAAAQTARAHDVAPASSPAGYGGVPPPVFVIPSTRNGHERELVATDRRVTRTFREWSGQLHALFWPHPKAWAVLATVWLIILGLHLSQPDEPPARSENSAPPTPALRAELRQQQQLLTELLGPAEIAPADRARPKPSQPRTQTMRISLV